MQLTVRDRFTAPSLRWTHVAPPAQALVEVLLADANSGGKASSLFGRHGRAHDIHHSESLDVAQAIRYACTSGNLLEVVGMETTAERRKRKLKWLCLQKGGHAAVAAAAALNPQTLDQVLKGVPLPPKADGTRSPRSLGDAAARAIENAYQLGIGWFDSDDDEATAIAMLPDDQQRWLKAYLDLPPQRAADRLREVTAEAQEFRDYAEAIQAKRGPLVRPVVNDESSPADGLLGGRSQFGDLDDDDRTVAKPAQHATRSKP